MIYDFSFSGDERSISRIIIGLMIVGVAGMIVLCFVMFYFWKRKQKRARAIATPIGILLVTFILVFFLSSSFIEICLFIILTMYIEQNTMVISSRRYFLSGENEDLALLPRMELKTVIVATEDFSCALGKGGFGIVYKV